MNQYAIRRVLQDAPRPWRVEKGTSGIHALVDANGGPIAESPMYGWLESIAEIVNEARGE